MSRRINLIVIAVLIIALLLSACAPKGPAEPQTKVGGDYKEAFTGDAVSFHPYTTTDADSHSYQAMVYTGALLKYDENTLEMVPNMAESYEISEDGLTFTFKLREGIKWTDGQPLTAYDYAWTFKQIMNPENEFPYIAQYDNIVSYKALDERTIEVKVEEIFAPALEQAALAVDPLPRHVWEKLDWKDPEKNPEIMHPSVVSGPFTLKEWEKDEYVNFEANDDYWEGRPKLDSYTILIVPDQEIAYTKLKNGEVDRGSVTPENYEEAKNNPVLSMYEWWPAAARWFYIGFNLRRPFFQDVNVRHALAYAMNKEELTDKVMLGLAERIYSVFPETSWCYNPDVPHYDYDPDKAKELLAEAGYTLNEEGVMTDADGKPIKLKLLYTHPSTVGEQIAVITQAYLKDIGVDLEVRGLEWGAFLEATSSEPFDWDLFLGGWRSTIEPQWMETIWLEESIPDLNATSYINKEVEELFKKAGATYDREERKKHFGEIQRLIAEDSPYIFLFYQKSYTAINKRVKGIKPTTLGIGYNLEQWYIEEESE